jgi:hypothetical protein
MAVMTQAETAGTEDTETEVTEDTEKYFNAEARRRG